MLKVSAALLLCYVTAGSNCKRISLCYLVDTSWDSSSSTILDVISTVPEYKECQHFCQNTTGCEGWTWMSEENSLSPEECSLYGELGDPVQCTDCISGPPACAGFLISGGAPAVTVGSSVEVYLPFSHAHCQLPALSEARVAHSMVQSTVCGGYDQWRSCVSLEDGEWVLTNSSLLYDRYYHVTWHSSAGLVLAGGLGSGAHTAEILSSGGESEEIFPLRNSTVSACAIGLDTTMVITGGFDTLTTAALYDLTGFLQELPHLITGRHDHACSHFTAQDGSLTYLVTGGMNGNDYLSSTEVLTHLGDSWITAGSLPSPLTGLRGLNLDNKIFLTGGFDDDLNFHDEILELEAKQLTWLEVGRMSVPRDYHAVCNVHWNNVKHFCYP